MNAQSKTAALLQTAVKNKPYVKQYRKPALLSSLKIKIGEFLLFESSNWQELEFVLRQYVDLKVKEVRL